MKVLLKVIGIPQGQGRPRMKIVKTKDGQIKPIVFNPKAGKSWKDAVYSSAKHFAPTQPPTGPVMVAILYSFSRPKSHYTSSGKLKKGKESGLVAQRPDLDNLNKATLDALTNLGYWRNDSQIVALLSGKVWTDKQPGAIIFITDEEETIQGFLQESIPTSLPRFMKEAEKFREEES